MVTIIIAYVGIILVNHIKAAGMPELEKISSFAVFFYSPFCDIYFLRTVTEASFDTTQAVYALLNDGFGFLILVIGEGILIWRRFIKKVHIFRMKWVDIFIVAALGGWFALRFLAEAVTILAFNVPDSIAAYWFVAYGISKVIGPLGFHWPDFYIITWSLSGIALAVLFASIPYHRKLWHIISAPLSMVINALSEEKHVFSKPEDKSAFTTRQLIEIDACVQCGICAEHCVTYQQHQNEHIVPGEVIAAYGQRLRQKHGLFSSLIDRDPPDKLDEEAFGKALYTCTLCGRCREVCPVKIDTRDIRVSMREDAVRENFAPGAVDMAIDATKEERNVLKYPNIDRLMWAEFLDDVPEEAYRDKEKADVVYFVGCMTSFSPAISSIAESNLRLLYHAGEDFALMGEEESCCGFPLIVGGASQDWQWLRERNVEKIKAMEAKKIVFNCASCYHTYTHEYKELLPEIEMLHFIEYLHQMVTQGKVNFKEMNAKITYHDPCDMGRGCGIFEEPREVIKAIPGIEFIEMPKNRRFGTCCGGGGDMEMVDADLVTEVADTLVGEIEKTGADIVISGCGQCKRMILNAIKARKAKVKVMDTTELMLEAGIEVKATG
jgi:heterodisulfide reductase subunit D